MSKSNTGHTARMQTIQDDPTTMETAMQSALDRDSDDTIADPEGAEARADALAHQPSELPIYLQRDYEWKRIRKDRFPDVASCVKAGQRAFMLVARPEHTQSVLNAIDGVYESLSKVKSVDFKAVADTAKALNEASSALRNLLGERHADDIVLAISAATQRTVAYLTDRLIGLEKYAALPIAKQEVIDRQIGDLSSTQEEAATLKLLTAELRTAAGGPASQKVNLKGATYDRMRAQANRNGSMYFHPEELAARGVNAAALTNSTNGVLLNGMLGRKPEPAPATAA